MLFIILVALICILLPYPNVVFCDSNVTIKDISKKEPLWISLRSNENSTLRPYRSKLRPKDGRQNHDPKFDSFGVPILTGSEITIRKPKPRPFIKPSIKCMNEEKSCVGRCSFKREFVKPGASFSPCFCDSYCDTVFNDCCADFDKECNAKLMKESFKENELDNRWKCVSIDRSRPKIWMIGSCKPGRTEDETSKKCAQLSKKGLNSPLISSRIPVIDKNNITFRNRYCALCNDVKQFTPWNFTVRCNVSPARGYSENEWIRFLDYFCGSDTISFDKSNTRAIRHCYGIIDKCERHFDDPDIVNACQTGSTGLVALNDISGQNYRNIDCFVCNHPYESHPLCGPVLMKVTSGLSESQPFSAIFTGTAFPFSDESSKSPETHKVPKFSTNIPVTHHSLISGKILKKYSITLQYNPQDDGECNLSIQIAGLEKIRERFNDVLKKLLDVSLAERGWQFEDLNTEIHGHSSYFSTFHVLGLWDNVWTISGSPLQNSKINNVVFNSKHANRKIITIYKFSLVNVAVREMACIENKTYAYTAPNDLLEKKAIFLNATQQLYCPGEYLLYNKNNQTRLGVCKNTRPTNCSYYLEVKNATQWRSFPNRTVYSYVIDTWFMYGEYSIVNGTLWLCLTKSIHANITGLWTLSKLVPPSPKLVYHHRVLWYTTIATLSISIISLCVLLVVYLAFPSLRNLPGKNLMLLCATLALGQLFWLLQNEILFLSGSSQVVCVAMVVLIQFLFLSSFCCSAAIAFHAFFTFRAVAKGRFGQRTGGKGFLLCVLCSLGFPLVFVAICWLLIYFKILSFQYRESFCWFADKTSLFIAFLGPIFILLFFNFILLLSTIRMIHKCTKARQKLAEKNGGPNKNHVGIYLRMSSMMGFTWFFGWFQIIFPDVLAFNYLFVITNGLQGLYIAVAFLFTDNVRKIISNKLANVERSIPTANHASK